MTRAAPPPGPEGEAVERVRRLAAAFARWGNSQFAAEEVYAPPIRKTVPADLHALLAAVDRLTAERDDARDLAFRAAFAPEFPFRDVSIADEERARRALRYPRVPHLDALVTWRPAPATREDGGDG